MIPGDLAPNFALGTVDGGTVSLIEHRGRSVLLVFLRHLG